MDLILCTQKNTRLEIIRFMLSDLAGTLALLAWRKFEPKKICADFSDPKKYTVKSSTQKNTGVENFRPKKIRRTPPSRLYPSTPPGACACA